MPFAWLSLLYLLCCDRSVVGQRVKGQGRNRASLGSAADRHVELRLKDQGSQESSREDCFSGLRGPCRIECPALEHQSECALVPQDSHAGDAEVSELVRHVNAQNLGSMS